MLSTQHIWVADYATSISDTMADQPAGDRAERKIRADRCHGSHAYNVAASGGAPADA